MYKLIKNCTIINERKVFKSDLLINNDKIEKIEPSIQESDNFEIIDGNGLYLIPGMIDTHVHFREPGLTHKATIESESKAAIAGGVTSFMEMPNTIPNTTTVEALEHKYDLASISSFANYSFYFGINASNLEEALHIDNSKVCGITDDGLYFDNKDSLMCNNNDYLEKLFSKSKSLIALHCENEKMITLNEEKYKQQFGNFIPAKYHADIRSSEACFEATKNVVQLAKKHNTRLHILHLSTFEETTLLDSITDIKSKRISAEVCVHHLYFNSKDYDKKGMLIKWNPSIKEEKDRAGLLSALKSGKIDNIATDHAPHLLSEKTTDYFECKSGAPSIQHAIPVLLELYHRNEISLEDIVEKTSHHPAELFKIEQRGYIREGYFADLVLFDLNESEVVNKNDALYKCAWSPFEGDTMRGKIKMVLVNGTAVYNQGKFTGNKNSKRLTFNKNR